MTQRKKKQGQRKSHTKSEPLEPPLIEQLNQAQDPVLPSAAAKKRMHNQLFAKIKAKQAEQETSLVAHNKPKTQPNKPAHTKNPKHNQDNPAQSGHLPNTLTIRAKEGEWVEIRPKVKIKPLYLDRQAGSRSFLMQLQPGASWPTHEHTYDEECIVLEGDVRIGDLSVSAGDYHLAPKGVTHGELTSDNGALLFLRAGISDTEPDLGTKAAYVWGHLNTRWKNLWGNSTE
ncbi:MAG: cupin domain-containing protein [bacterium]